jgi:Effector-associated domain 1/NACHT domain
VLAESAIDALSHAALFPLVDRKRSGAASYRHENWVRYKMEANPARRFFEVEMGGDGLHDLRLKVTQVSALCGDPATSGAVPNCREPAALLVQTDFERYLFHIYQLIQSCTRQGNYNRYMSSRDTELDPELTPEQLKLLRKALLSGYGDFDEVRSMVRYGLDERLETIPTSISRDEAVAALIEWAENRGKVRALSRALVDDRPDNPHVKAFQRSCAADAEPDMTPYLEWLREKTKWIDLRGFRVGDAKASRLEIDKLYITLRNREKEPVDKALEKNRRLVVQGDAGSGKSTFLQRLAHEWSSGRGGSCVHLIFFLFP